MRFSQTPSPLMDAFFAQSNQDQLQKSIQDNVNVTTGYKVGPQNQGDLLAIMGKIYTDLRGDTEKNVDQQVSNMNQSVLASATRMIISGIKSDLHYLNDISKMPVPLDLPKNNSVYGTRLNR
jgi:hypothetical protein